MTQNTRTSAAVYDTISALARLAKGIPDAQQKASLAGSLLAGEDLDQVTRVAAVMSGLIHAMDSAEAMAEDVALITGSLAGGWSEEMAKTLVHRLVEHSRDTVYLGVSDLVAAKLPVFTQHRYDGRAVLRKLSTPWTIHVVHGRLCVQPHPDSRLLYLIRSARTLCEQVQDQAVKSATVESAPPFMLLADDGYYANGDHDPVRFPEHA